MPSIDIINTSEPRVTNHQDRIWWPWIVTALVLLLTEIMVRKMALPTSWSRRLSQNAVTDDTVETDYDTLVQQIDKSRDLHLQALRQNLRYREQDSVVRARIHVPGNQNR